MRLMRVVVLVLLPALALRAPVAAQDSPFGIRGLGVPGRSESVRARATGGAFGPFDALSALTETSLSGVTALTASAGAAASYLKDEVSGLRETRRAGRFPIFQVMGPVWNGVVVGGGFTTYLDRSYRVVVQDTIQLAGTPQPVTDDLASNGGVTDIRLAAARRFGSLVLGAGFHLLSGSTRLRVQRTFADSSNYLGVRQTDEVAYSGAGASVSAALTLRRSLAMTAFYRTDGKLTGKVGNTRVSRQDLPATVGVGLQWRPAPDARFAATLIHSSWANAATSGAFNVTNWAVGAELGSLRLPLRLGVRSAQLPFGPGTTAPRELAVAAGSGLVVAHGLGVIDFTIERLRRTGSGLTESGWTLMMGLTLRPTLRQ